MENDIWKFVDLLERNGFSGAEDLMRDELIPIAKKHGISLYDAARRYADADQDQDTSFYQLAEALCKIRKKKILQLQVSKQK